MNATFFDAVRKAARQEQFLEVLDRDEAVRRFHAHLSLRPGEGERLPLAEALGRVLKADVTAPVDVPPFDRSSVDGFAVRAADTSGASETRPRRLVLNREVLACGVEPTEVVGPGTATVIATGGVLPRGADAIVMVEHTELVDGEPPAIEVRRAAAAGQFVAFAGGDMARGETILRAGGLVGSRELGMLAACGIADVLVVRRPRVGVLSTGDELVPPGERLPPGGIFDSNAVILAAAVAENGGEPVPFGIVADDEAAVADIVRRALAETDLVVMSGGTSKGAGDVSHRTLSQLGAPGILVHGVALKPGKPLCLAVVGGKPVIVLPGFPTSAVFTFQEFAVPVIRALAGLPPRSESTVEARMGIGFPSELGRTEYVMVALAHGPDGGLVALPLGKGSGSVTAFSQADGFVAVDALSDGVEAGETRQVRLIGSAVRVPDLTVTGSHCIGLDRVLGLLAEAGFTARTNYVGSLGGLAAALRGECDVAPAHILDPQTGRYNVPLLEPGLSLVPGWRRMQGIVFRPGDARFAGRDAEAAAAAALADPDCVFVNRNAGSGTRVLADRLLGGRRPPGYANQPRSHNAVAAAVANGRADWGIAIASVGDLYGLGFLPIAEEHYDFFVPDSRRERPAVAAFVRALADRDLRKQLAELGFAPTERNTAEDA
jgi:putative molybdopterin biosynthesis protein